MFNNIINKDEYINDILFVNLNKDIIIGGEVFLDKSIEIPIISNDLSNNIKEKKFDELINTEDLAKSMGYLLALDNEFKYIDEYKNFLLRVDKNIYKFYLSLALNKANEKRYDEAIIYFHACYIFNKEDLDFLINYGRVLVDIHTKEFDKKGTTSKYIVEAKEVYDYLLENYPNNPLIHYDLAFIYLNDNNNTLAKKHFLLALELKIDNSYNDKILKYLTDIESKVIYEKGIDLILNDRVQEGLEKLLSLEIEYNDWWNLYFYIALGYKLNNDLYNAIRYYNKVLELNTGHYQTMKELGFLYLEIKDYDKAIEKFHDAYLINSKDVGDISNVSLAYIYKGDYINARKYIDIALKYDENNDEGLKKMIEVLKELENG